MIVATLISSGRVQGVGYRAFVAATARAMGIRGYASNLEDGTVETVCECGSEKELAEFISAISRGTWLIKVDEVRVVKKEEKQKQSFDSFEIR